MKNNYIFFCVALIQIASIGQASEGSHCPVSSDKPTISELEKENDLLQRIINQQDDLLLRYQLTINQQAEKLNSNKDVIKKLRKTVTRCKRKTTH